MIACCRARLRSSRGFSATPTPDPTETPDPTQDPDPTGSPDPTDKPDPTQKPDPTEKPTATKSPRPEFQRTAPYTLAGTHDLNGCRSYTMTTVYSATLPRASHPCRLLTEGSGTDFGIKAFS